MRYRLDGQDGSVGIHGDRLVPVGSRFDFSVPLGSGELRAGLINAHDHLHRNHYPRLGTPPYEDAYAWGLELHARHSGEIARARALPRREALLFGALKNLLGGVTSVVHHDPWEPTFERDFPLRVVRLWHAHSPGFDAAGVRAAAARGAAAGPLMIHVAEGVNAAAAEEVRTLDRAGLVNGSLLAVHLVGADVDGVARLHAAGAATVWCPTSNHFLFGRTAPAELLGGGDVLLGTDALLTGAGTLLDELRAARALGTLDDGRLHEAVGRLAARRLGMGPHADDGHAPADLVLLRRPLLEASARDVALVIVGGVPRLGDDHFAPLFQRAGVAVDEILVGGVGKLVCSPLGRIAARVVHDWPESGRILAPPSARSAARTA